MKKISIEELLDKQSFTKKEKDAFMEIIRYAKYCEENQANLKSYMLNKIEEVIKP